MKLTPCDPLSAQATELNGIVAQLVHLVEGGVRAGGAKRVAAPGAKRLTAGGA